jgi:hypothetical protein
VLFLCGERLGRSATARRLMTDPSWPFEVSAVATPRDWRRHSFGFQIAYVDGLFDDYGIAVAHGYDAWVLMAAAEQRSARGAENPFLLLLNPVLGCSQHLNGSLVGYRAPRGARVRSAFGLEPDVDGRRPLTSKVAYVFGDNDRYSSERDWRYLRGLGCRVYTVRGWHPRHRGAVEEQLQEIIADYSREVVGKVAARRSAERDSLRRAVGD